MARKTVAPVVCLLVLSLSAVEAGGRPDKDWKSWFGHVGVGYALGEEDTELIVQDEFRLNGGAVYWPTDWPLGLGLDLAWSEHDIRRGAIDAINAQIPPGDGSVTGGDVALWSLGVNALWGPKTSSTVGFYLTAGIGADYIDAQLTDNGLVYYPPICDPWFWWCIPGGVGPGTFPVAQKDTTKLSYDAGVGLTFNLGSSSQLYFEATYHIAETSRVDTATIPFILGFRW